MSRRRKTYANGTIGDSSERCGHGAKRMLFCPRCGRLVHARRGLCDDCWARNVRDMRGGGKLAPEVYQRRRIHNARR
jgi:hypothetical protein